MENPKKVEGRVIKFRAWSGTKMYYPRPGCDLLIRLDGRKFVQDDIGENSGLSPADDLVFMQFTGLLDKNGKEIWEADILLRPKGNLLRGEGWQEVKAPVRYIAEHGGFCWADWRLDKDMAVTCEVVGNEYEGDI